MLDDDFLRRQVHAAIRAGNLPNRSPGRVWAGPATAGRCTVCDELTHDGVEFELIFADERDGREKACCLHPRCLHAFERELERLRERAAFTAALTIHDGSVVKLLQWRGDGG
jgi:hypothetical protein